jgi:hypothetical protein
VFGSIAMSIALIQAHFRLTASEANLESELEA